MENCELHNAVEGGTAAGGGAAEWAGTAGELSRHQPLH